MTVHIRLLLVNFRSVSAASVLMHQTTVLVGNVFKKTRTDLRKWFWAIFLVAQDKRGISARLIADQLGFCYPTAWAILHKISRSSALCHCLCRYKA